MELKLAFETADPPTGWIVVADDAQGLASVAHGTGSPVRFCGWLGLLQALEDVLDLAARP